MRHYRLTTVAGSEGQAARPAGPGVRSGGFTLVEMLVVLLIIAIVLAMGAGVATAIIERTDKEETKSRLSIVWEAINVYAEENNGDWPTSLSDMASTEQKPWTDVLRRLPEDCTRDCNGSQIIIKDRYGNNLVYSQTGGMFGQPSLYSMGPDGKSGTAAEKKDDIRRDKN